MNRTEITAYILCVSPRKQFYLHLSEYLFQEFSLLFVRPESSRFSGPTKFQHILIDPFYNTPKQNLSLCLFPQSRGCCIVLARFARFNTIFIKNHKIPGFSRVFQVYCHCSGFVRPNPAIIIHMLISTWYLVRRCDLITGNSIITKK